MPPLCVKPCLYSPLPYQLRYRRTPIQALVDISGQWSVGYKVSTKRSLSVTTAIETHIMHVQCIYIAQVIAFYSVGGNVLAQPPSLSSGTSVPILRRWLCLRCSLVASFYLPDIWLCQVSVLSSWKESPSDDNLGRLTAKAVLQVVGKLTLQI